MYPIFVATSLCGREKLLLRHRVCKSVSGPNFGLRSEHLSVVFRGIGFIRSQTRQNSTTSTIAEADLVITCTQSIFVRSLQRSTTYTNVALFPFGINSSQLHRFVYHVLLFCTSNQAQRSNNVHGVI